METRKLQPRYRRVPRKVKKKFKKLWEKRTGTQITIIRSSIKRGMNVGLNSRKEVWECMYTLKSK